MELILAKRARQFNAEDFKNFQYIFVMDKQNFYSLKQLCQTHQTNSLIQLLNKPYEIEDPYYGDDKSFEIAYNRIYQGCKRVLSSWR